jgi:hypothetical protein
MINKEILFEYGDNNSEVLQLVHPSNFTKTAEYSQVLVDFIKTLKEKADKIYALVNALSAGEFYGSNRNGDYFPEEALKEYHKTFEALGHVYRHHVNKDPEKSMGKVVFSHYNPEMHRVELIIELDKGKAEDVVTRLDKGDLPAVSMGCRVPWDECSICGNRARTRKEYCDHLVNKMNHILPGGQRVVAINRMPKFFDISVVLIPADRTAGFLSKVAGYNGKEITFMKSARLAPNLELGLNKFAEQDTYAEIRKNIEAKVDCVSSDPKLLIRNSQSRIPEEKLKKLAEFPLNQVLSTMNALRIFPLKEDFQKLALYNLGEISLADELERKGEIFSISADTVPEVPVDVNFENYNEKVAELLMEDIPDMAMTKELIVTRALTKLAEDKGTYFDPLEQLEAVKETVMPKYPEQPPAERSFISKIFFGHEPEPETTAHKNPLVPLGILGGLYYGYAKVFNNPSTTGFRQFMLKNKWLLPVLVGAGTVGSLFAQDEAFKKTAGVGVDRFFRNSLVSIPVSYYISGVQENKAKQGEPITETENFIRKHPVLTGLVASLGLVKAEKLLDKSLGISKLGQFVAKMDDAHLQLIYTDLIN